MCLFCCKIDGWMDVRVCVLACLRASVSCQSNLPPMSTLLISVRLFLSSCKVMHVGDEGSAGEVHVG